MNHLHRIMGYFVRHAYETRQAWRGTSTMMCLSFGCTGAFGLGIAFDGNGRSGRPRGGSLSAL